MLDRLRKEAFYPYPPERVWVALTDRRALAEWLMPNNFAPVVGHRFQFQVDPMPGCNSITECEVLEVDRPRRLVYSWRPVPRDPSAPLPPPSRVTWMLHPHELGTRLVLEHTGLAQSFKWWERFMLRFGWGTMVKRWIPKVTANVSMDGNFTPGAIPLAKRCYKCQTVPEFLTR
jgi:uncharacterized protein YndB with AHSA1/START domain